MEALIVALSVPEISLKLGDASRNKAEPAWTLRGPSPTVERHSSMGSGWIQTAREFFGFVLPGNFV